MTTAMKDNCDAVPTTASRRLQYRLDKFREVTSTSAFMLGSPVALGDAQLCVMLALQESVERLVYRGALAGAAVETLTVGGLVCRLIDQAGREVGSANVGPRGAVTMPVQHEDVRSGVRCTLSLAVRDTPLAEDDFWDVYARELIAAEQRLVAGEAPLKLRAIPATELVRVDGQSKFVSRKLAGSSESEDSLPETFFETSLRGRTIEIRMPRQAEATSCIVRLIVQDPDGNLLGTRVVELSRRDSESPSGYWFGRVSLSDVVPAEWVSDGERLSFYCVPQRSVTERLFSDRGVQP